VSTVTSLHNKSLIKDDFTTKLSIGLSISSFKEFLSRFVSVKLISILSPEEITPSECLSFYLSGLLIINLNAILWFPDLFSKDIDDV
jgi:hypothetical protein